MGFSLRTSFKTKAMPGLIGMDISASAVKLVELGMGAGGQHEVERAVIEPLPRGAISEGSIAELEAVIEATRRAVTRLGSRTRRVALALPAASVTTRRILVPDGLGEEELELHVRAEAAQYIPFDLEEVNLDFQILGAATSSPGDCEVLIAAARRDKVEEHLAVAEGAGLEAVILDVDAYATIIAFELMAPNLPNPGADQAILVADIGASQTRISVVHGGQPVYSREQGFGGDLLTQETAQQFGLQPEEAEDAKRERRLPDPWTDTVLAPWIEAITSEIDRSVQFFFSSTQYSHLDGILLSGGGTMVPELKEAIQARCGLPVILANPFAGMKLADSVNPRKLFEEAGALMTACGLALRRFDP